MAIGTDFIDLSWTQSTDNVGVTGYEVYKDGVLEATLGNVLSYRVNGLTSGTTYSFKIKAFDAAGNRSDFSNEVTATTL